ncbi:MAG: indolepyruvate oxidoreductase subunit beta [Deltaproteobacteria bacterium]|jgi:indolepyruvate ferredoxin oxidoreductase, beta subunit|nr:indolepyruvate oxidoreductase subunit beta [Deltaproteobacteria bacterium]
MGTAVLKHDPTNLIITGVGGQGNVLASKILGSMLIDNELNVTVGETFGASQRGGSVMSHLRIGSGPARSPQIPMRRAHAIVALEAMEALQALGKYGNPETLVIANSRPIYPMECISGECGYPEQEQLEQWLQKFSGKAWIIEATKHAMNLGAPIYANIIMIGALAATGILPLNREGFKVVLERTMSGAKVAKNLDAFDLGTGLLV